MSANSAVATIAAVPQRTQRKRIGNITQLNNPKDTGMTFRQSTHRNLCNLSSKRSRSHDPVLCAGRGITRVMAVVEARPASVASEASVMLAARPLSSARSFSVAPVIVNSRHLPRASCSLVCDATTNLNDIRRQQQQQRRQVYRPKTTHTSSSSFLYEGYADSPADLMEMMRRIVRRGGIGRKQDNVPKEVGELVRGS